MGPREKRAEITVGATNKPATTMIQRKIQRLPSKLAAPQSRNATSYAALVDAQSNVSFKSPAESLPPPPPQHKNDLSNYVEVQNIIPHSLPKLERSATPSESQNMDVEPKSDEIRQNKLANGTENEIRSSKPATELSDHSDIENEFGRLPESAFPTIEDSRDSLPSNGERILPSPASRKTSSQQDSHSKDRPFPCRTCGAGFASRAGRYIHEQTHAGARAHACGRCGRTFRWRAALARHEARHAARADHVCPQCGRAFSVACDLRRHARAHAPECHRCELCPATFKQTRYLKVHMENIHLARTSNDPFKKPKPRSVPEVVSHS